MLSFRGVYMVFLSNYSHQKKPAGRPKNSGLVRESPPPKCPKHLGLGIRLLHSGVAWPWNSGPIIEDMNVLLKSEDFSASHGRETQR